MSEEEIARQRMAKFSGFVKKNPLIIGLILLVIVVYIAVHIRLMPTAINPNTGKPGLWDIAADQWTLGPDLDPFLFLRWAKEIVAQGSLAPVDYMRYVPIGYDTAGELLLLPHSIAWFHSVTSSLGLTTSVDHSAVIYPVFMFSLTVIAFFFLALAIFQPIHRKITRVAIALVSALFLSIIPVILPRTIAGIPEKESAAFLFMFLAFLFFILSWRTNKTKFSTVYAALAGIATGSMALIWGGYTYLFVTFGVSVLILYLLGQVNTRRALMYVVWLVVSVIVMYPFSERYSISNLASSTTTGVAFFVLGLLIVDYLVRRFSIDDKIPGAFVKKTPREIRIFAITILAAVIVAAVVFGPHFFIDKITSLRSNLVKPITDRVGVTVAENRQPYFQEWASSFGPLLGSVPLFFWLFFIGSIYLFAFMIHPLIRKERILLTGGYAIFLVCVVFSRYSSSGLLNGENGVSLLVYALGFIALLGASAYVYVRIHKLNELEKLKHIDVGIVVLFVLFFLSIVSARGAVRLIMVLVPPASLIVSYFVVSLIERSFFENKKNSKMIVIICAIIVAIAAMYSAQYFYKASVATAQSYIPSIYTQQWQYAMKWVRESTSTNAVFAHWWDYGYWVQSIGGRATVLDGGNSIPYWNHLMGRHVLTAPDDKEGLIYLYTHNATHLLIDSTDIGKYGAFSSIGSDQDYDRRSYISTFLRDSSQTLETKNKTTYLYNGGGFLMDEDLYYNMNGTQIFLPEGRSGVGGVLIERSTSTGQLLQPSGFFIYNQQQYLLPLRYAFAEGQLIDFKTGVEAGVYIFPRVIQSSGGLQVDPQGAIMYLSRRTFNTQIARYYLFKQPSSAFSLVHSEDDLLVANLKSNNIVSSDIIYFEGLRGPIRIWEINYPAGISTNSTYLQTNYPDRRLVIP